MITTPNSVLTAEPGDPALPLVQVIYAAPNGVDFDIDILIEDFVTLDGYYVLPAYDIGYSEGVSEYVFMINDDTGEVYDTDYFFPDERAELGIDAEDQYLQEQRLVNATYVPFEFNPIDEELRVYTYSLVEIEFDGTASWNTSGVGPYEDFFAGLAPNYDKVSHDPPSTSTPELYKFDYSDWDEDYFDDAKCDYLVIAAKTFADIIDPDTQNPNDLEKLLLWRSEDSDSPNGFDIMVAPLDEIVKWFKDLESADRSDYNNYEVGIMVDDFIEEVYEKSTAHHIVGEKLEYVLLLGDSHSNDDLNNNQPPDYEFDYDFQPYDLEYDYEIPIVVCDTRYHNGDSECGGFVLSDSPYACIQEEVPLYSGLDGDRPWYNETDYVPEIKIGRLSADDSLAGGAGGRSAEDVMKDIAEKILYYEEETGDSVVWRYCDLYFNGFKSTEPGSPYPFQKYRLYARDYYEAQQGYGSASVECIDYDDDYDEASDAIEALLDNGERLFLVHSHGGPSAFSHLNCNDADGIDFDHKTPAAFVLACTTGNFCETYEHDSGRGNSRNIGEVFLRQEPEKGGVIAYLGATQETDHTRNAKRAGAVLEAIFKDQITEVGYIWMKLTYVSSRLSENLTYVLLGDPACDFGDPRILDAGEPNLVVSWGNTELTNRNQDLDDGDWPYLNSNNPLINVAVNVKNIGGGTSSSTTADFYFYDDDELEDEFDLVENVTVPALAPGETAWIAATGDYGSASAGDYDKGFVCKVVVVPVDGEISPTTGTPPAHRDNTVWYPDDNVKSWEEDDPESEDEFDPQPITFYDMPVGWPTIGQISILIGESKTYESAVVLADLVPEAIPFVTADEIIVLTTDGCLSVVEGDGDVMDGWPVQLEGTCYSYCPPSVGNVDDDSDLEIVAYSDNGKITAFDTNGSEVWDINLETGYSVATPVVIANLDNQGENEIIFGASKSSHSYVYAYTYDNGDMTEYSGWGTMQDPGREEVQYSVNGLTVVDLDSPLPSPKPEVIYTSIYVQMGGNEELGCIEYNGNVRFANQDTGSGLAPLAINLNGTGNLEILYRENDTTGIRALTSNGILYPYPADTDNDKAVSTDMVFGTVGVGVNAKDVISIIASDGNIYAWNKIAQQVVDNYGETSSSSYPPLLADVDGDGGADFIGLWNDGNAYAYEYLADPYEIDPYPFRIFGTPYSMPAVGDIDGDNDAELIFIVGNKIIAINLEGDEDDIKWGQFHHDATHDNAP